MELKKSRPGSHLCTVIEVWSIMGKRNTTLGTFNWRKRSLWGKEEKGEGSHLQWPVHFLHTREEVAPDQMPLTWGISPGKLKVPGELQKHPKKSVGSKER